MGTYRQNVDGPIGQVQGPLIGQCLLEKLKAAMVREPIWQQMFGGAGEHIFVSQVPSYNGSILPLIEFWWESDRFQSNDTMLTGQVTGRILLPPMLKGDTNRLRDIALTFMRWLGSDQLGLLHPNVAGLTSFGVGASFSYDRLVEISGLLVPHIPFILPYTFDVHYFEAAYPEIDFRAPLTTAPFGPVESYEITVLDDKGNVRINTQNLLVPGQSI